MEVIVLPEKNQKRGMIQNKTTVIGIVSGMLILASCAIFAWLLWGQTKTEVQLTKSSIPENITEITVDVKGNVNQPGVYTLPNDSRVIDAVEAAGGFTDSEDGQDVNLARRVTDGEMIVIGQNKINLNTADLQELKNLSGIGDVLAQRIIDYRTENGKFYSIEEIQQVQGIGKGMFEKIKNLITV